MFNWYIEIDSVKYVTPTPRHGHDTEHDKVRPMGKDHSCIRARSIDKTVFMKLVVYLLLSKRKSCSYSLAMNYLVYR